MLSSFSLNTSVWDATLVQLPPSMIKEQILRLILHFVRMIDSRWVSIHKTTSIDARFQGKVGFESNLL